jgi:hypothetical protein
VVNALRQPAFPHRSMQRSSGGLDGSAATQHNGSMHPASLGNPLSFLKKLVGLLPSFIVQFILLAQPLLEQNIFVSPNLIR